MGSPVRLLNKVKQFENLILQTKTKLVLHFNEYEPNKVKQRKHALLQQNCDEFINNNPNLAAMQQ